MSGRSPEVAQADPFDLPDWLGEVPVEWASSDPLGRPSVAGRLVGGDDVLDCDVLACDRAYPAPVLAEQWRREAHSAWALGQVLLLTVDGRLTLVTPGVDVSVDGVLEALRRLARAVGVMPERYAARIRL